MMKLLGKQYQIRGNGKITPEMRQLAWKNIDHLFSRYKDGKTSKEESCMAEEIVDMLVPDDVESKSMAMLESKTEELYLKIVPVYERVIKEKKQREKKRDIVKRYVGIAAAFAIVLGSSIFFTLRSDVEHLNANDRLVAGKEAKQFDLPDGTKGWVGKESQLLVAEDYNRKTRTVSFKGNVGFKVDKNHRDVPFIAEGNCLSVLVLGTSFEMSAYDDIDIRRVIVKQGVVLVSDSVAVLDTLRVGQGIVYDKKNPKAYRLIKPEASDFGIEAERRFTMNEASPMELIVKIRQTFGIATHIDDRAMKQMEEMGCITTTFFAEKDDQISAVDVMERLKIYYAIDYTLNSKMKRIEITVK